MSKLKEEDVVEIKRMLADGCLQYDIAVWFDITPSQVSNINRSLHWKWV